MRGMEKAVFKSAVFIGALLGLSAGAVAQATCTTSQDPRICVEVVAPGSRTYSQPFADPIQMTFVTYRVTINNGAASSLNRVKFAGTVSGTTDFVDPATGLPVFLANPTSYPVTPSGASTPSLTCTLTSATSIECGGAAGVSVPPNTGLSFDLMVNTPNLPMVVPDPAALITLAWTASYGEGSSSVGNADTLVSGTAVTALAAPGNEASANFPASGGVLATASDEFYTKVEVPFTGKSTSVNIKELEIPSGSAVNCTNFRSCQSSEVTVPDVITSLTDPLKFELVMMASNIKKGVKIESVLILYTGNDIHGQLWQQYPVGMCPIPNTPLESGLPCTDKQVFYKNKNVIGWTPDLNGAFHWFLLSRKNGRFQFF